MLKLRVLLKPCFGHIYGHDDLRLNNTSKQSVDYFGSIAIFILLCLTVKFDKIKKTYFVGILAV
jgi:hypothetical protein